MITRKDVLKLAKVQADNCISIYVPTHRAGEPTYNGEDAIHFKNQLKVARQELEKQGTDGRDIDELLKPAEALVNDKKFWRYQSDGLVLFISEGMFETHSVPLHFEERTYVSNEFYLAPLMPLFNGGGRFYLLTLKKDEIKLYEGMRHSIAEIDIADVVPQRLEDRVGYDYEEKHLQQRSQQGNGGKGMYHGHGDDESDEKEELMQFFKAVDNGVMCVIGEDQRPPLVLCCQDHHYGIYKEANSYSNIFTEHISKNPADLDMKGLHQTAIELLKPYFEKARKEKSDRVAQYLGTGKAVSDVNDILPNAIQGLVDTLFVSDKAELYGIYDMTSGKAEVQESSEPQNVSLVNLAAVKVFEQGGHVFLTEKDDMPDGTSEMNALLRT